MAQIVGAGYSVSEEAGLIATLVKMLRVACLPVLVIAVHFFFRDSQQSTNRLPWFLVLFVVMAVAWHFLPVSQAVVEYIAEASRWMLVTAIAALGLQTNLKAVLKVHPSLLIILLIETLFILGLALIYATNYLA